MGCQWSSVMWGKKESLTTTLQVQSSNSPLELEDRAHENLEDPHPSARSLKFRYENLEDRQPNAPSLKKYTPILEEICERNYPVHVPWRNMWKKLKVRFR